ncbi:hypothetical protein JRQ81_001438 [Phrynocephalus forsythii]|uniref:Uncharacterized protein n=1 Tax=Phrynocephalus forsythii TaxID=171643 RepID=A0A9Q0Y7Y2_9SAUR|nr:hypothetical protein JRQ81_001438 [Phrynocephalus forsythii]
MERRSERLALLKKMKPISYWESRVKRVFKKIRSKRQSAVAESKKETKSLKAKSPQTSWRGSNSRDSVEPCCSECAPSGIWDFRF